MLYLNAKALHTKYEDRIKRNLSLCHLGNSIKFHKCKRIKSNRKHMRKRTMITNAINNVIHIFIKDLCSRCSWSINMDCNKIKENESVSVVNVIFTVNWIKWTPSTKNESFHYETHLWLRQILSLFYNFVISFWQASKISSVLCAKYW